MGLQQKLRSLYCGLPAGLNFEELNGKKVVYVCDTPYELEAIITRWIGALPSELLRFDSPNALVREGGAKGIALTELGWEYFVTWMLRALTEAQVKADFDEKVAGYIKNGFRTEP